MNTAAPTHAPSHAHGPTLFGHPTGLFTLFFAEMWERFSYYGMRALLAFYMIKGFLGYNDSQAYAVYGAYTALVYMTPYFGGMLADRLLGRRRAVIVGGILMAAGHLLMGMENDVAFFTALALLIAGNGFFKPNISTIVGELYPKASEKKDAGFTIFYMCINLGAAMSPIVCGYIGETYGWHYGFGLATIGMLIGVAVFVAPTRLTQALIGAGAFGTAIAMPFFQDSALQLAVRLLMSVILIVAGAIAILALQKGPLPRAAGAPPDPARLKKRLFGVLPAELAVYIGTALAVVAFAFIVQRNSIAGYVLQATGLIFLVYVGYDMVVRCDRLARNRLVVVLILFFFNLLFWAFFEQAGTSLNNWTDRNIDRVQEARTVEPSDVGSVIAFRVAPAPSDPALARLPLLSQEQLGHVDGDPALDDQIVESIRAVEHARNALRPADGRVTDAQIDALAEQVRASPTLTMTGLTYLRAANADDVHLESAESVRWRVVDENVGMGIGEGEIPASEFQAANPIYILLFGLPLSLLWAFLATRHRDPSTPVKFVLGVVQLGLGFAVFWWGTQSADARGMSSMAFLLFGWLLITTGELFSSPIGLSMVTKLSPSRLVSTIMGGWFLATAFSNYLAAVIATFTVASDQPLGARLVDAIIGIFVGEEHGSTDLQFIGPPSSTVSTYGEVFGLIALIAIGAGVFLLVISPFLRRGMHLEELEKEDEDAERAGAEGTAGAETRATL